MRLRSVLVLTISSALVIAAGACFATSWWFANNLISESVDQRLKTEAGELSAAIQNESRRALSLARLVASMPTVVEAFAAGDRARLETMLVPTFAPMKDDGVEQFQFHTAPATSFLRVHSPKKFGDDLSSFRKTVVQTNGERKSVLGLESGVAGIGIRGVVPLVQRDRHLGSVEFGLEFGQRFAEEHTQRTGARVAIFLHAKDGLARHASTFPAAFELAPEALKGATASRAIMPNVALEGGAWAMSLQPLKDYSGEVAGVLAVAVNRADLDAIWSRAVLVFGTVSVLMLALAAAVAGWLQRGLGRPLQALTERMSDLAAGRTDVSVDSASRIHEVQALGGAVQVFKNALIAKKEADEAAALESDAKARRAEKLDTLARRFEADVSALSQSLSAAATEMEATARSMTSTAEQTSHQSVSVAGAAEQTSANVQAVAVATEELSSSIHEIAAQVAQSSTIAGRAADEARRTDATVQSLSQCAQTIGDVIQLIGTIAGQTNLLALNATIEAARAGEAGRGFAVVATEVKELAGQTSKATEEISAQIARIQAETQQAVQAIEAIGRTIGEMNGITTGVAAAMEEQGAATGEIARSVQQASQGTRVVSESILEVKRAAGETGSAATQVLGAAQEVARHAEGLSREVESFLAEVKAA